MTTGVLFLNFGGPTRHDELQPFLESLLFDVLPLPGPAGIRKALAGYIAKKRTPKVAPNYKMIGYSTQVADSQAQADEIMARLGRPDLPYAIGMMFTEPSIPRALDMLAEQGVTDVLCYGLFPHFSFSTAGSAYDMATHAQRAKHPQMKLHFARSFHDHPKYLKAMARAIRRSAEELEGEGPIHLVFSGHGIPISLINRGDPYQDHVRANVKGVVDRLGWTDPWQLAWQSRIGPSKWLTPNLVDVVAELGAQGVQRLLVCPVSFVGEHIETLHELDIEVAHDARSAGIPHYGRVPVIGHDDKFLSALADHLHGALDRIGKPSCMRCHLPEPAAPRTGSKCPNCSFVFPDFVKDSLGIQ